ncbi:MAG: serine protease [Frankiales bacterium]|nr:serine protease [Frankiales bacterium]
MKRHLFAVAGLALAVGLTAHPADAATRRWAAAGSAKVHPGVQTVTKDSQCTANFVFTAGTSVYLGQAAHCSSTGGSTDTNGCLTGSLPLGTPVSVAGYTGTLAYNSWLAMRAARTTDASTCAYNDLALIKLPAAAVASTNPSIPVYGGPTGLGSGTSTLESVFSYGNSGLRFGLTPTSPKRGTSLGDGANGWTTTVYTATPGIPGDSGSGFLDGSGRAFGVLSTVGLTPYPLDNGVGNLAKEIAFARAHGVPGLALVNGTQPFTPNASL